LSQKKVSYETKISSLGSLSSSLSSLKGALSSLKNDSIFSMKAESSDESVFTVTSSLSAVEGTYKIKVNNVATKQGIYSTQFSSENSEVADLTTHNTQKIQIKVGDDTPVEIIINSSNNTLTGIRDAINNSDAPVKASIVSDDGTNYRLIISSDSTGEANRMVIKVDKDNDGVFEESPEETDNTGLSRLAFNPVYNADGTVSGGISNMTQSQSAVDADIEIDGLTVKRSSNTIDNIITGVTINLLNDSDGKTLTLNVSKDISQIENNINSFVSAYNSAMGLTRSLSVSKEGKAVILSGDNTLNGVINTLRSTITTPFSGNIPSSFGLSHDKNGVLSLNTSKLATAIENDLQGVIETFDAMAGSLEDTLDNFINTAIPAKKDGLESSIDRVEDSMDSIERRLEKVELNYRRKFMLLEQTLSQLQQDSDFLLQKEVNKQ
jgi:flagellar hook-associated protein 2